jgi:hypothetical protein
MFFPASQHLAEPAQLFSERCRTHHPPETRLLTYRQNDVIGETVPIAGKSNPDIGIVRSRVPVDVGRQYRIGATQALFGGVEHTTCSFLSVDEKPAHKE